MLVLLRHQLLDLFLLLLDPHHQEVVAVVFPLRNRHPFLVPLQLYKAGPECPCLPKPDQFAGEEREAMPG